MIINNLFLEYNQVITSGDNTQILNLFYKVIELLESGKLRVANQIDGSWQTNIWIKNIILQGFRLGKLQEYSSEPLSYIDKDTYPARRFTPEDNIRIVPGGSSIRRGAYVSEGTIIMPPSYVNTGAYIDSGCMVDSHALVGSCAQIGKNVHISAASQIGGVLEPVNALPVIIEDNVFIGGNCGIYEGTIVMKGAVIGSGVVLNSSTPLYDNTTGNFIRSTNDSSLVVPTGAVVVAGSRPINRGYGHDDGVHLYCPVIIKYRDQKTNSATTLEELLR